MHVVIAISLVDTLLRVLVQHTSYAEQAKDVEWHIRSKYSVQMDSPSKVVSPENTSSRYM